MSTTIFISLCAIAYALVMFYFVTKKNTSKITSSPQEEETDYDNVKKRAHDQDSTVQ